MEAQAAHEETHMRGTEDPNAYPGLTFQLIGNTSLPVNKGQWLSYHRSESTSPQIKLTPTLSEESFLLSPDRILGL